MALLVKKHANLLQGGSCADVRVHIYGIYCEIFGIGASWGGYSSLLSTMDVAENRHLESSYVPKGEYLRIYAGSENIDDLINDLENGFKELN